MSVVEEVRLIWSESATSDADVDHNKAWHGFLHDNGDVVVEWGRVGKKMQSKTHHGAGAGKLATLKKQKLGKGYKPQRTVAGTINGQASGKALSGGGDLRAKAIADIGGSADVKALVGDLVDANIHTITGASSITYNRATGSFETPLGLVTPDGIADARKLLDDIAPFTQTRDWDNRKYIRAVNEYMEIVPTDVGMKRGWHRTIFAPNDALAKQNDILDALDAALLNATTTPMTTTPMTKTAEQRVFEVKLDLLDKDKPAWSKIHKFYQDTKGSHRDVGSLDVKRIFKVRIPTIYAAFQKDGKKVGGIVQLWHGTKMSNLLSILKIGLIIPPTHSGHVTGRMFGNGLYFSDQSTKSLRYATNAWGGGGNTKRTFMFMADVAMGKPYTPSSWSSTMTPKQGYDSVFAKAGQSGVQNNEMIVYRTSQADLCYLIEFTPNGR